MTEVKYRLGSWEKLILIILHRYGRNFNDTTKNNGRIETIQYLNRKGEYNGAMPDLFRDELPRFLFGWNCIKVEHEDALWSAFHCEYQYPPADYNSKQAILSRALSSLESKGLIFSGSGGSIYDYCKHKKAIQLTKSGITKAKNLTAGIDRGGCDATGAI